MIGLYDLTEEAPAASLFFRYGGGSAEPDEKDACVHLF